MITALSVVLGFLLIGNVFCPTTNISNQDEILRNPHNNNNLCTGFYSDGDIGSPTGASMEFPGGSGIQNLYRGYPSVGYYNGSAVVIATHLC